MIEIKTSGVDYVKPCIVYFATCPFDKIKMHVDLEMYAVIENRCDNGPKFVLVLYLVSKNPNSLLGLQ